MECSFLVQGPASRAGGAQRSFETTSTCSIYFIPYILPLSSTPAWFTDGCLFYCGLACFATQINQANNETDAVNLFTFLHYDKIAYSAINSRVKESLDRAGKALHSLLTNKITLCANSLMRTFQNRLSGGKCPSQNSCLHSNPAATSSNWFLWNSFHPSVAYSSHTGG